MLLHACLHRAVHISNPYYVGGRAYFGGGPGSGPVSIGWTALAIRTSGDRSGEELVEAFVQRFASRLDG
jgi:hypothetical protein